MCPQAEGRLRGEVDEVCGYHKGARRVEKCLAWVMSGPRLLGATLSPIPRASWRVRRAPLGDAWRDASRRVSRVGDVGPEVARRNSLSYTSSKLEGAEGSIGRHRQKSASCGALPPAPDRFGASRVDYNSFGNSLSSTSSKLEDAEGPIGRSSARRLSPCRVCLAC